MNKTPNNSRPRKPKGFTLLEILVVIVVIGILAAMVAPRFANVGQTAQANATLSDKAVANRVLDGFELAGGTIDLAGASVTTMNGSTAALLWTDLHGGTKVVGNITFALPSTSSITVPDGWTLTKTGSGARFK